MTALEILAIRAASPPAVAIVTAAGWLSLCRLLRWRRRVLRHRVPSGRFPRRVCAGVY